MSPTTEDAGISPEPLPTPSDLTGPTLGEREGEEASTLLPAHHEIGQPRLGRRFRIGKQCSAAGMFGVGILSTFLGLGYVVKDPLTLSLLPLGCSFVALVGVSVALFERRRFRLREELTKAFWAQECPEWYIKEAFAQAREEGCEEYLRDRLARTPGPWKGLAVLNTLQLARKDLRADRQSPTEETASC